MSPAQPASRSPAATASPAGPAPTITARVLARAGGAATRTSSRRGTQPQTYTRPRDRSSCGLGLACRHHLRRDEDVLLLVLQRLDAVADRDHHRRQDKGAGEREEKGR